MFWYWPPLLSDRIMNGQNDTILYIMMQDILKDYPLIDNHLRIKCTMILLIIDKALFTFF